MKKAKRLAALAALALSGCFTVDVATSPILGDGIEKHVVAENYGWYLFGCLPLACGNKDLDSWCPFSLFCDEVRPELVYEKMTDVARRESCRLRDVTVYDDNNVLFDCYVTIPWIVVTKDIFVSATLEKIGGGE